MTLASGEIGWGATIDGASSPRSARDWRVELEHESLGSLVADTGLTRFAAEVNRLAPDAAPAWSLTLGRLTLRLTLRATDPEEAADAATDVFERALEAALWPRPISETLARCDVRVTPVEDAPGAA